jgi:hypothetical protein
MTYKTMVLDLLRERPQMYDQLRKERKLLAATESYAKELKKSHQAWTDLLTGLRPGSAPHQIASEAMEIALKELEDHLQDGSQPNEQASLFLDAAMLFLRNRTSRG